jgi:hypothetical protein
MASLAWEGAAPRPTQPEEGGPALEEELCPVIYGERKEETENLGERGGVEGVGSLIYSSTGRGGTHARAVRGPRGVAHLSTVDHDAASAEGVQNVKEPILPQKYTETP